MRILGIDPGFAIVGFGLVESGGGRQRLLRCGAITTPAGQPLPRRLRQIADDGRLPAAAGEILRVERIRENRTHRAVVCRVRRPGGAVVRRTCFLFDGIPDADLLLRELERRESWENSLEPPQDKDLLRLLLSALACAGFAAVCALSHPAVGRLPSGVYFPCLGAAFAAFCAAVTFAVRRHRGE